MTGLVRAGLRGTGVAGGLEGLTTAAARHGVRVAKGEAAAHKCVDEVDLAALHVHGAHRVDDHLDAVMVDDRVAFLGPVGERHAVREARASARRHVDAKREVRATLLRDDLLELLRRLGREAHDGVAGAGLLRVGVDRQDGPPADGPPLILRRRASPSRGRGRVWTWRRGACVSRRRRRSPDGRAATCSIRSATRSSWTRSVPEFHFSPRPNRAGEIAWRPWGEAAFAEARSSDKPVLLAISAV